MILKHFIPNLYLYIYKISKILCMFAIVFLYDFFVETALRTQVYRGRQPYLFLDNLVEASTLQVYAQMFILHLLNTVKFKLVRLRLIQIFQKMYDHIFERRLQPQHSIPISSNSNLSSVYHNSNQLSPEHRRHSNHNNSFSFYLSSGSPEAISVDESALLDNLDY